MASIAEVTPGIITWAREYNKLTRSELADKVHVHENQISNWEDGVNKPTFNQAVNLATALNIPFGYLFLTKPPSLELPLPDLRTRGDRGLKKVSASLREVLYGAFDRYDWYREYLVEYGGKTLPFVGKFTTASDPKDVAASIRKTIGISQKDRDDIKRHSAYLSLLSDRAETAGILVMRSSVVGNNTFRPLSAIEFQGFVITDDIAPVIFINGEDFVSAQIFTFAHELAHVWIGKSGISKADEADVVSTDERNVETFCNLVAVETLVPETAFLREWKLQGGDISSISRRFWVSRLVIARRAYELDKISANEFFPLLRQLKAQQKKRKGGRADYYANVATRHSPTFTNLIIQDVRAGGTLMRDGAKLLDMKLPTFAKAVDASEF